MAVQSYSTVWIYTRGLIDYARKLIVNDYLVDVKYVSGIVNDQATDRECINYFTTTVSFIKAEGAYPTGAPDPAPGFWCSLPFSVCEVPLPSVFRVVCCACPCYLGLVIVSGLLLPLQWWYFLFSSQ